MPKRGRLTRFFQKNKTINQMGDRGQNLMTYSEALIRDLHESGWEDMTTQEAGVLIWLTDLTASNPHQVKLSEKIHLAWDAAVAKDETFGVINCISIASEHWAKVREIEATISGKQPSGGGSKDGNTDNTDPSRPPKKKRKRNKKLKDSNPEEGVAATVTTTTKEVKAPTATAPAGGQKPPTPQYCFCCGESDHTVKGCKEQGPLKCDLHTETSSHKTKACSKWRQDNNLLVHPWLLRTQGGANQVNADNEGEIFGNHPDDSLEVLSEADSSLTQPGPSDLHACHVTISGFVTSDDNDDIPDTPEDPSPPTVKRKLPKASIQAVLRSSKHGRRRARDGPTGKCHGRVHLSEYSMSSTEYARSAADGKTSFPAYSLLMTPKVPTKSASENLRATTVLLDTGASVSLMPAWQAEALKLQVTPRSNIVIRGADGHRLTVNGTSEIWVWDPCATFWKKVKVVVTRDGSWTLISPRDQKRLWRLQKNYPTFLGTGRFRRPDARASQKGRTTSDSGVSDPESDSDTDCEEAQSAKPTPKGSNIDTANSVNSNDAKPMPESPKTDTVHSVSSNEEFSTPLPPDEVEVQFHCPE